MTLNITKEDVGTVFKDRDGDKYRMIAWNEGASMPVVVVDVEEIEDIAVRCADGKCGRDVSESCADLIARVEPRREYWVNVYRWSVTGGLQTGEKIRSSYEAAVEGAISSGACIGPINITDQIEALLEKNK